MKQIHALSQPIVQCTSSCVICWVSQGSMNLVYTVWSPICSMKPSLNTSLERCRHHHTVQGQAPVYVFCLPMLLPATWSSSKSFALAVSTASFVASLLFFRPRLVPAPKTAWCRLLRLSDSEVTGRMALAEDVFGVAGTALIVLKRYVSGSGVATQVGPGPYSRLGRECSC